MFRAIILPIIRSIRRYNAACGCLLPQAALYSLMLLMMGKIIARNMSSKCEFINKVIFASSWFSSLTSILMIHGQTNINLWLTGLNVRESDLYIIMTLDVISDHYMT
jgi:hypothetical protein